MSTSYWLLYVIISDATGDVRFHDAFGYLIRAEDLLENLEYKQAKWIQNPVITEKYHWYDKYKEWMQLTESLGQENIANYSIDVYAHLAEIQN